MSACNDVIDLTRDAEDVEKESEEDKGGEKGEEGEEGEEDDAAHPFHGGVYVLANRDNRRTYVGCAGISFFHRLRQHNREISGGAPGTCSSRTWFHRFLITGFRDTRHALSFEWFVKHYVWFPPGSFTQEHRRDPIQRRRRQIELLIEKYGTDKFPELTLHENPNNYHTRCICFDCLNKGQPGGEIGRRIKKITPTQKQNVYNTRNTRTKEKTSVRDARFNEKCPRRRRPPKSAQRPKRGGRKPRQTQTRKKPVAQSVAQSVAR